MQLDTLAREFAAHVPMHVRETDDGYDLVGPNGAVISAGHVSARHALEAGLGKGLARFAKTPNLRSGGKPDGVWRWLDATATVDRSEPLPNGKLHRIAERAIWEMAAGLNARESAVPINGGGAPDGYKRSEPHGDGFGGDHPANGFAHIGVPVLERGRVHLYLRGELLPEVAVEVDRGRLAYGSVRFGFADTDEADDHAVVGAELISHALTNDPAITSLGPGSANENTHAHVAQFTRRAEMEAKALDEEKPDPAIYMRLIEWAREALGKPDATPKDVLAELEARLMEIGDVLGVDTPPPKTEPVIPTEDEEQADELSALRAELAAEKRRRRDAEATIGEQREHHADERWLNEQIAERGVVASAERREYLMRAVRAAGRASALPLIANPPKAPELDHRAPVLGTKAGKGEDLQHTYVKEAERRVIAEYREAGRKMPASHVIFRLAIAKAREEHPEAFRRQRGV